MRGVGRQHWQRKQMNVMDDNFTEKQGQYLSFIYNYTKINGCPPAEADIQRYFRVTPPTVHQMILTLEQRGFIHRIPGQARTIKVLLPPEQLPYLK
jgi:repressor LexA